MKIAAFKLAGVALSLSLAWTSAQAAALRVAADPVPHAEILNYIKKIDPSLDLKVVELTSGVNANELLANGDVDANYFQHVPYLKDQEKALGKTFAVAALATAAFIRLSVCFQRPSARSRAYRRASADRLQSPPCGRLSCGCTRHNNNEGERSCPSSCVVRSSPPRSRSGPSLPMRKAPGN